LHLRTLLLALLCAAGLAVGQRPAPPAAPAAEARPAAVLRAGDGAAQPFLARAGAVLDGLFGVAPTTPSTRELHHDRARPPAPRPDVATAGDRSQLGFMVTLRRARRSGLTRFGGPPPPDLHA
jgi:hypothetical protein